jgi:hypothetical protein
MACTGGHFVLTQVALQIQGTATPVHEVFAYFDVDSLNRTYTAALLADFVLLGCRDDMVTLCTRPKYAVIANDKRTIIAYEGMDLVNQMLRTMVAARRVYIPHTHAR